MKATTFILLFLICVSFTSCTKWDSISNSSGGSFFVNFVNNEGENLVVGLKTNGDSHTEISKFEYNYRVFVNEEEKKQVSNYDSSISICSDNPKYLHFGSGFSPTGKTLDTVSFQLVCPHIFGNGETNTITAIWKESANFREEEDSLVDLQFNGKSIPLESEDGYKYRYKIVVE